MRRRQRDLPRFHHSARRLVLLLLLLAAVAAACGLFSCSFRPMLTAHGTLLFLPEG